MLELKDQQFPSGRLRAQADQGFYSDFVNHFQVLQDAEAVMVAIRSVVPKLRYAPEFPGELLNPHCP